MALSDLVPSVRAVARAALVAGAAVSWAAVLAGSAAAQTAAPAAPEATETRSVHEDWTVRCQRAGEQRACEATQTLAAADLKSIFAHVAVRAEKSGLVRLIVLTPPGVWLPANVTLKVPGVPDIALTYKRCGQHCVASAELKSEELAALKASAGAGDLVFEDGSRRPIILPVSFKGLGDAMRASLNG